MAQVLCLLRNGRWILFFVVPRMYGWLLERLLFATGFEEGFDSLCGKMEAIGARVETNKQVIIQERGDVSDGIVREREHVGQ